MSLRNYLGNPIFGLPNSRRTDNRLLLFPLLVLIFPISVTFAQNGEISALIGEVNSDSLLVEIQRLSGEQPVMLNGQQVTIESRCYNTVGNVYAFKYIQQKLSSYGLQTESRQFSTNGMNLFGLKSGTIFPDRVCIIGAHYDDIPTGAIAPGADDNASGCAAVLEAARILADVDFPNTVVFAFWDEEEPGLIGSTAYVNTGIHGDSLLGYINLDMIGWDGNSDKLTEIHSRNAGNSAALAEKIIELNQVYSIGLNLQLVNPGSINTDHYPFWQSGLTAVGINEEYQGDVYPYYHTTSDQYIHIDTAYMRSNAKLAIASILMLALNKNPEHDPANVIADAQIFPNPTSDQIHVQFTEAFVGILNWQITNEIGEVIIEDSTQLTDHTLIDLSNLAAGLYTLRIFDDMCQKVVSVAKL